MNEAFGEDKKGKQPKGSKDDLTAIKELIIDGIGEPPDDVDLDEVAQEMLDMCDEAGIAPEQVIKKFKFLAKFLSIDRLANLMSMVILEDGEGILLMTIKNSDGNENKEVAVSGNLNSSNVLFAIKGLQGTLKQLKRKVMDGED